MTFTLSIPKNVLPSGWEGFLPSPHKFLKCLWPAPHWSPWFLGIHVSEVIPELTMSTSFVMNPAGLFLKYKVSVSLFRPSFPPSLAFLLTGMSTNQQALIQWGQLPVSGPAASSWRVTVGQLCHQSHKSNVANSLQSDAILFPLPFLWASGQSHNYSWWQVAGLHHILTLAFSYFFYSCQCAQSNTCLSSQSDRS